MTYARIVCLLAGGLIAVAGIAREAAAQVTPPLVATVKERAASIEGACVPGATVRIAVKTSKGSVRLDDATCSDAGRFTTEAEAVPLLASYQVVATQTVGDVTSAPMVVDVQQGDGGFGDQREDLESTAFVGLAIDTFGSDELNKYLNPEANGDIRERSVFGIDFAYRLIGDPSSPRQVWVYGETIHGVRSEDIDCEKTPALPSCQQELAGLATDLARTPFFLLRNASSLEAYMGVRVEWRQVQLLRRHPAALYVSFQPGFLEVSGSDGDAKAAHHIGVGARVIGGRLAGSYLEVGFGKTDLFIRNRNRRFKFDGMLQRELPGGLSLFAQLFADVDMRDGSDSIQSYFGLNFDVGRLFNPQPASSRSAEGLRRR